MEDILVESEHSKTSNPAIFSKLAFGFAILTFALLITFFIHIGFILKAHDGHPTATKLLTGLLLISMLLG